MAGPAPFFLQQPFMRASVTSDHSYHELRAIYGVMMGVASESCLEEKGEIHLNTQHPWLFPTTRSLGKRREVSVGQREYLIVIDDMTLSL